MAVRVKYLLLRAVYWATMAGTILIFGELTARIDDRLTNGVAISASPDLVFDLTETGPKGERHGRPNGRFRHYRMNSLGLVGPETTLTPSPGRTRILVLGSSETFGSTNSPGHDYPAQLAAQLTGRGDFEVLSSAIPGMTARAMLRQFENWTQQFEPHVAVVYCNPLFYLNINQARADERVGRPPQAPPFASRLLDRLRDAVVLPQWLVDERIRKQVDAARREHPDDWVFRKLPERQFELFAADYRDLVRALRDRGTRPILVTHAISVGELKDGTARETVARFLEHSKRSEPEVVLEFDRAINQFIRQTAQDTGSELVDLDRLMTGRAELFSDLVHFNDQGASFVARMLSEAIRSSLNIPEELSRESHAIQ